MDWFQYIRENIFLAVAVASLLTSLVTAFINLSSKGQQIENTKLNIAFAVLVGLSLINFDAFSWDSFVFWQNTAIQMVLTIVLPYLVAKFRGQEIVDSAIAKAADAAKNVTIGKKEQ